MKDDGGAAFPRQQVTTDRDPHGPNHCAQEGMSLRDYFAAKALQSLGEDVHSVLYHVEQITGYDATGDKSAREQAEEKAKQIAIACGVVADAMLKERSK